MAKTHTYGLVPHYIKVCWKLGLGMSKSVHLSGRDMKRGSARPQQHDQVPLSYHTCPGLFVHGDSCRDGKISPRAKRQQLRMEKM